MNEINEKPGYYSILPASIRYDEELTSLEKLLYSEITSLCDKSGSCWAKNKYFANLFGKKEETISRNLKKLEKKNYIQILYKKVGTRIDQRAISIVQNSQSTIDKNVNGTIDKNVNGYIDNNIYKKETNKLKFISKEKKHYGELQNVLLTNDEYQKLKKKFGSQLDDKIENLSLYISSKNKRYSSHYATILAWDRKENKTKGVNLYERL